MGRVLIVRGRILRGRDLEGWGSYCEEWAIKGRGDPEGLGSYCEEWAIEGRGDPEGLGSYCEE